MWSSARRCRIGLAELAALPTIGCAAYLEKARWESGFVCRAATRTANRSACEPSGVLTCRKWRSQTGLTVGTVMKRSRTPLSVWFWAAYLVAANSRHIRGQLQRQLGLSRYETAFQLLTSCARNGSPDRDRIGGRANEHVEVDETWVGGRTRGEGRGVHHKTLVACAVEVRRRAPEPRKTRARTGATPGAFGSPSPPTEAQSRFAASSRAPWRRGR